MAIREILKEGDVTLRKKSRKVEVFDKRLHTLLDDMYETLKLKNGVGLAAPQIGVLRQVIVIDTGEGLIELINPEIIRAVGVQTGTEGCLSIPGKWGTVTRPKKVTVKAQDRYGAFFELTGVDLLARAFCHEIDHLNGILFIDTAVNLEAGQ